MVGIEHEESISPRPPSYYSERVARMKPHPEYYLEKGNLTVEIQDTVFKVSDIKFWTHSEFFSLVSQENGTTLENLAIEKTNQTQVDQNRPWKLKDVEVDDFTRLLWILYPLDHGECKATTTQDWEGILKLADRWAFHDIFNLAVRKLSALEIDPVKKVQLMHKHKIRREWAIDAFVALTLRDTFPEVEEATVLGIELTTYLAKTRERVSYLQPIWNRRRYEPVKAVVCEEFKLNGELKDPKSWQII